MSLIQNWFLFLYTLANFEFFLNVNIKNTTQVHFHLLILKHIKHQSTQKL